MLNSNDSENAEYIDIDFSWEIVEFKPTYAKIQLFFDVPEILSPDPNDPDNVMITFWAGDLFEAENGKSVRPGLTIRAPVLRQVKPDDKDLYKDIGRYSGYSFLLMLLVGYLVAWRM